MGTIRLHDLLAAVVSIGLLAGILGLVFLDRPIPDFLQNAFAVAMGFTFRGGVQTANDFLHTKRSPPL